jgi:hypothetical protein
MKRIVIVLVPLALALLTAVAPAGPAGAAGCTSPAPPSPVNGGFRAVLNCNPGGTFNGFGSTSTDASRNVQNLYQLFLSTGQMVHCTANGAVPDTVTGGYRISLYCQRLQSAPTIDSVGSTVTDAFTEARALVDLWMNRGVTCGRSGVRQLTSAWYQVTLTCYPNGVVNGFGGTVTDAAQAARLAASIG